MATTSDRGLFVWHELNTTDLGAADDFYSQLIGWKSKPWEPNPSYKIWTLGAKAGPGCIRLHEMPKCRDAAASLAQLHRHARR